MTTTTGRIRLTFLDGVRALAAVYVVLHHMWLTAYPDYPNYRGPVLLGWLGYGQLAVSVFIVVSGFSLSIAPARRGWQLTGGVLTYLRRRAWRILPTYWAALLLSSVVFGLITPKLTGGQITGKAILVHALLVQDIIGSPKPNGAFWSIAVEWQIYFLFPLFLLVRRRLGVRVLLASVTTVIIAAYLLAVNVSVFSRLLHLTPQFVALFVFGMAAAEGVRRSDPQPDAGRPAAPARSASKLSASKLWSPLAAGLALTVVVLLASHELVWVEAQYFWIDLLAGAATGCLLISLTGGRPARLQRFLSSRPLTFTGGFSYSIYCVHLPFMWLVWHFALHPLKLSPVGNLAALFVVAFPVVLLGSYLFSLVFERPFLTHRSFGSLRDSLPAAPFGWWLGRQFGRQPDQPIDPVTPSAETLSRSSS